MMNREKRFEVFLEVFLVTLYLMLILLVAGAIHKYFSYNQPSPSPILKLREEAKELNKIIIELKTALKNNECPKHYYEDFDMKTEDKGDEMILYTDVYICGRCGKEINKDEYHELAKHHPYYGPLF